MSEITDLQYWIDYRDNLSITSMSNEKSSYCWNEGEIIKEISTPESIAIQDEIERVTIVIDFLKAIYKNNGFNINQLTIQG